jgi:hypothetical protein
MTPLEWSGPGAFCLPRTAGKLPTRNFTPSPIVAGRRHSAEPARGAP